MKRILIIGSNGAGKTTFSYALSKKLKLPLTHLDQLYWYGNWEVTPPEEFKRRVLQEAEKPAWIIEGNNIGTLADRLPYADTVFWFEFPPHICLLNIMKREVFYFGRVRPDMPDECASNLSVKFLLYARKFNRKNRKRILYALHDFPEIPIIRFTNRKQVNQFLQEIPLCTTPT